MRRVLPGVVVVLVGCGGGGGDVSVGGVAADSAGVRVWSIPAGEHPAELAVERVHGFALPDSGWTVWTDGIAADPEAGIVYVLDETAARVLAFGVDGRFLRQVGRKGQGPDEYQDPTAITVDDDGNLVVFDPGTGSVRRWSREGEYLPSEPLEPGFWGPGLAASPRGLVYATASGEETGTMIEALVSVGPDGVDTLSTVESYWKPLEMPCGRVSVPEVFSLGSVWGARGSLVASASVPRYEVTVRGGGAPRTIYRWDVPPRAIDREEAEAFVVAGPLSFLVEHCGMTAAAVAERAGWVEEVSPIFLLSLDGADRVWAARGVAPEVEAIDVFDPDEGYLGTLRSPAFPVLFLDDSRYLTILPSDFGSTVELWRVVPEG